MKILEKVRASVLIVVVAIAPGFAACQTGPALSPDAQQRIADLEADYAAAVAAGDEQAAAQAESDIAAIEADAIANQTATFMGTLASLFSFIPGGSLVIGALTGPLAALAPALWRRPRRHLLNVVKDLNPWHLERSPSQAISDLGKMYGLLHSSPSSEVAADTTS